MIQQQQFLASLKSQPLFAPNNTQAGLGEFLSNPSPGSNLYLGTGLATSHGDFSAGLPFDFLGMMLAAEWIRRKLGLGKAIQEISDTHALNVGSPEIVAKKAVEQKELVERIARNLGLADVYEVTLASTYQATADFQKIQTEIQSAAAGVVNTGLKPQFIAQISANAYFRMQWSGMTYLRRERNVQVKLGWLMEDNNSIEGFDERAFDCGFMSLGKDRMSFAYVFSGLTFNTSCNFRVIPYTAKDGEQRLMLQDGETAYRMAQWLPPNWPATKNQPGGGKLMVLSRIRNILNLFQELFPQIPLPSLPEQDWIKDRNSKPIPGQDFPYQIDFILREVCGLKLGNAKAEMLKTIGMDSYTKVAGGCNGR